MEMPHYSIESIEYAKKNILIHAQTARLAYLENLLDGSNSILWDTFNIALQSKVVVLPLLLATYSHFLFLDR